MKTVGVLVAAGYDFDDLIDKYSFEQIGLLSSSVMLHKIEMLNLVAEPLMSALGSDYSPAGVDTPSAASRAGRKKNSHKNANYKTPEEKERAMLMALAGAPVRVRTKESSTPSDG